MGGYGSGRWDGHAARPVAEDSMPLNISLLADSIRTVRQGFTQQSVIRFAGGGQIGIAVIGKDLRLGVVLRYRINDNAIEELIKLVTTPVGRGHRFWWECPGCARRVGVLFKPAGRRHWRCRTCWNITYQTSNESDSRASALARGGDLNDLSMGPISQVRLYFKAANLVERRVERELKRAVR